MSLEFKFPVYEATSCLTISVSLKLVILVSPQGGKKLEGKDISFQEQTTLTAPHRKKRQQQHCNNVFSMFLNVFKILPMLFWSYINPKLCYLKVRWMLLERLYVVQHSVKVFIALWEHYMIIKVSTRFNCYNINHNVPQHYLKPCHYVVTIRNC